SGLQASIGGPEPRLRLPRAALEQQPDDILVAALARHFERRGVAVAAIVRVEAEIEKRADELDLVALGGHHEVGGLAPAGRHDDPRDLRQLGAARSAHVYRAMEGTL